MPEQKESWFDRLLRRLLPARLRTAEVLLVMRYVVLGGLTFLVNNGLFILLHGLLRWAETPANLAAVILAVVFAYLGSKWFVFRTRCKDRKDLLREAVAFFSARAVTMVLEIGGFELLVRLAGLDPYWTKLGLTILIILLNYVFSKLFVFRQGDKG